MAVKRRRARAFARAHCYSQAQVAADEQAYAEGLDGESDVVSKQEAQWRAGRQQQAQRAKKLYIEV